MKRTLRLALAFATVLLWGGWCTSAHALSWPTRSIQLSAKPGDGKVTARFAFENRGDKPVRFTSIHTGCDCTAAKPEREHYLPGEAGAVEVEFKLGSRLGRQEKTIVVESDDAPGKPVLLLLSVEIAEPISISPRVVFWRIGGSAAPKSVELQSASDDVSVEASSSDPRIATALEKTEAPGVWRLVVSPTDTSRALEAEVTLTVSGEGRTRREKLRTFIK